MAARLAKNLSIIRDSAASAESSPVVAGLEKPGGSSGCVQRSGRPAEAPAPAGAIIRVPRPATSASDPCSKASGCCSRRPARCAWRRCSSSPRCVPTCCRASPGAPAPVVLTQETPAAAPPAAPRRRMRYADAAKKAMPAVVNIYTSKECARAIRSLDDPLFRRYFPDLAERLPQRADEPGLRRDRLARRLRAHQPPRDRRRRRHPARARRRPRAQARVRGTDPEIRPRGAEGGRRRAAGDHVRHARARAGRRRRCSRSATRSASATR